MNLDDWTFFIKHSSRLHDANRIYLRFLASNDEAADAHFSDVTNLEDLISPIAWKPGEAFAIVASCARDDLRRIATAFMRNRLVMEQGERKLIEISS